MFNYFNIFLPKRFDVLGKSRIFLIYLRQYIHSESQNKEYFMYCTHSIISCFLMLLLQFAPEMIEPLKSTQKKDQQALF